LGYLYWKTQQYERAKKEFDLELEIDSASAQALAYLGDIEWKNDRPEPAISFLTRAAKISPSLRIVETDLGAIYLQQKKYKSAETALLRAVGLDPRQPDAHYQLARLYQALGDKAAAGKQLRAAQDLHQKAAESLLEKISSSPPSLNLSEPK
jgi:tetratricopeptide (TPR) repeat protein